MSSESASSDDEFETDSDDESSPSVVIPHSTRVKPKPISEYRKFRCSYPRCSFKCSRHREFAIHLETTHECPFCARFLLDVSQHICPLDGQYHRQYGMGSIDQTVFKLQLPPSHKGVFQTYEHKPTRQYVTLNEMFSDLAKPIKTLLTQALDVNITIKVQLRVLVDLEDIKKQTVLYDKWISTAYFPILHPNFINNYVKFLLAYLNNTLEIWNQNESGYTLKSINMFQIRIAKYKPLAGGEVIPLPKEIARRRGLLNIHSSSFYCFHFAITAAFHSSQALTLFKNRKRVLDCKKITLGKKVVAGKFICKKGLTYNKKKEILGNADSYLPFLENFNFKGLRTPVPIEDICIFEKQNNISVNCYGMRGKEIIPLKTTDKEMDRHVDLLLITNNGKSHYVLITDLPSFLGADGKHRHIICKYCLRRFRQKHALDNHMTICVNNSKQKMRFPKADFYQFDSMHETLRYPYVLYYDFETFSRDIKEKIGENTMNVGEISPAQYSLILIGPKGLECARVYDGDDVTGDFLWSVNRMADKIKEVLKNTNNRITLTIEQEAEYQGAVECSLCRCAFTSKNVKCRHHHHITGQHLGIICATCNKKARTQYIIPIISHGGTNFDHHLIVNGMDKKIVKHVKIIPQSGQKFMGFILNKKLKFLDSCKFMPGKLSAHAKCLLKDGENGFKILFQYFARLKPGDNFYKPGGYQRSEVRLLLGKQAFPYEIMKDSSVFNLTELPPIEKFRNSLKLKDLKPETYKHAQNVWRIFNCATIRDYSRLYCLVDTLILACIMEAQRNAAFGAYGLEMLHKWSAPGFSHSAGMYSSKAKIQYIKDEEMVKMIRSSIRGGPCFCNTRLFTANNERIGNYNPEKPRTHIFYADLKSLYPSCLLNSMPVDGFEWLTEQELEALDVPNLPEEAGIGYILECDLIYDSKLHDSHNDLPLAPEKMNVTLDDISCSQHDILRAHKGTDHLNPMSVEKLVLTLQDKESYVSYYKTLKFYLKQGLKIKGKVKRGIKFREAPIFRDYIANNLAKREAEFSEVMKLVYKLVANSFYGKMLQSSSKFKDVILCMSMAHALHLVSKAEFNDFYPLGPDLSIFIMDRKNTREDSLFVIAFVVLELAKLRLMQVHYQGVKSVFGENCRIAYSDTDSAIYLINDPANTYLRDLKALSWLFDYSNMKGHELYDTRNVGRAGKFKMEAMDIYQFCGLSAKLYSYIKLNSNQGKESGEKKAKGVSKAVVKHTITHDDYVRIVTEMTNVKHVSMNLIRSRDQQMYNQTVKKVALSALDMKRYLLPNGIDTLAIGHYRTVEG